MQLVNLLSTPLLSSEWFREILNIFFSLGVNQLLGMACAILFLIPLVGAEKIVDSKMSNFIIICILGALVNYIFTINKVVLNTITIWASLGLAFTLGIAARLILNELQI